MHETSRKRRKDFWKNWKGIPKALSAFQAPQQKRMRCHELCSTQSHSLMQQMFFPAYQNQENSTKFMFVSF